MPSKPSARKTTWMELAARNAGIRKAMTALTWAYCCALVRESIGHDPTVDEVADWWKESRRTAFRKQSAFRAAFPDFNTPAPIFEHPSARNRWSKPLDESPKPKQQARSVGERQTPQSSRLGYSQRLPSWIQQAVLLLG